MHGQYITIRNDKHMNYEEFLQGYQEAEADLRQRSAETVKYVKAMAKDAEKGTLKNMDKNMDSLKASYAAMEDAIAKLEEYRNSFDSEEYFSNGGFSEGLEEACRNHGVDMAGEFPVFEMFPYKVRIDSENQDVYIDRKKYSTSRPEFIADTIAKGQEKLNAVKFNSVGFASELEDAYMTHLMRKNLAPGAYVSLKALWKELVPMARSRKEYDEKAFAFDIARMYKEGSELVTKKGSTVRWGSSRTNDTIRILDTYGCEVLLSSIAFLQNCSN